VERLRIPRERIRVAYPGVDARYRPDGERHDHGSPYVFTTATEDWRKNRGVVEAALRLRGDDLTLLALGDAGSGYVTDEQLTAVKPVWLDVRDCGSSEFDVPGTGGPGSTFTEKWDFTMPEGGRIVAAGGHLHGGAVGLDVTDTTCGRSLYSSLPTWGGAPVFPVMHEPGPTHMSSLTSSEGIPFAAGDTLRLSATYDDSRPHVRAMGISIAYILPGQVSGCPPLPAVAPDSESHPGPAPVTVLPLLKQPTGRLAKNITTTQVGDYVFAAQRVSIARGTMFTWNFVGAVPHDVTLATGPVGFSSPHMKSGAFSYTFTRPGVYKLFCSLHPTRMTQVVTVR
jgi:plastocyanin